MEKKMFSQRFAEWNLCLVGKHREQSGSCSERSREVLWTPVPTHQRPSLPDSPSFSRFMTSRANVGLVIWGNACNAQRWELGGAFKHIGNLNSSFVTSIKYRAFMTSTLVQCVNLWTWYKLEPRGILWPPIFRAERGRGRNKRPQIYVKQLNPSKYKVKSTGRMRGSKAK